MKPPRTATPTARFLGEFISKPWTTGAVIPSSQFLAKSVIEGLQLHQCRAVLEYGPGTGIFTEFILREMPPDSRFVAIEINPAMAAIFRTQHPGVPLVEDSVANVQEICRNAGIDSVDCIISGLPWAGFSEPLQKELLDAMMRVLKPGGRFVTFAYAHGVMFSGGKRFAQLISEYFSSVSRSSVVWRNLPPAFVYRCTR